MEVTEEQRPQWNAIITDVFGAFIKICKENNLCYFCCGGTAIGAIRHQGMIPWDDDIDVFMPRPDYDRFVEMALAEDFGDYEIVTPYVKENYPLYFAKFCNRKTTLQEEYDIPCVYGLYIDIFPIDGAPDSYEEARKMVRRFIKIKNKLEAISTHSTFWEYVTLLSQPKEWGRFVRKTIGFFFRKQYRSRLLQQMQEIMYRYDYENSTHVAVYCGAYGPKEVFPKAWLCGTVNFSYEGMEVALPAGYDDYLRQYYGDYMQLPPEEKRISHHQKVYFNIEAREADEVVWEKARSSVK